MSQPRDSNFHPSSPHSSSGGADSYKHEGTPDTRLTTFSPDESSVKSTRFVTGLGLSASEPQPVRFQVAKSSGAPSGAYRQVTASAGAEKDPFVTTTQPSKAEQKLSPTASSFRPYTTIPLVANGSALTRSGIDEIVNFSNIAALVPLQHISPHLSTDLHLSRCIVVFSPTQLITISNVEFLITKVEQRGARLYGKREVHSKGERAYVRFTNIRDAILAQASARLGGEDWCINFVPPLDFIQALTPGAPLSSVLDGQITIVASFRPGTSQASAQVENTLFKLLQQEADLYAFQLVELSVDAFRAIAEFSDSSVPAAFVAKYDGLVIDGVQLSVKLHKAELMAGLGGPQGPGPLALSRPPFPDLMSTFQNMTFVNAPQGQGGLVPAALRPTTQALGLQFTPFAMYPQNPYNNVLQATGPLFSEQFTRAQALGQLGGAHHPFWGSMPTFPMTTPAPLASVANELAISRPPQDLSRNDGRRQNAMRVARSPYYNAAGHHNHVDVNRIREGIDVRTTIMLRNIPNKVDQAMLKRIVDESSWGKYDFMYLRIDFANDCNVGYAFINFVDPLDIIDFVNARGNQRWNCFKSDKVAEISYATIQGKDCLVQKFRNSSVMLEASHYRPKLYFTSNGPRPDMAGDEEPFPEPDNPSKMKRSCENAEHVGLFTPNAGQHFRDEQRRRRSQYDRGTRLAALEEYNYDDTIQQLYTA